MKNFWAGLEKSYNGHDSYKNFELIIRRSLPKNWEVCLDSDIPNARAAEFESVNNRKVFGTEALQFFYAFAKIIVYRDLLDYLWLGSVSR